MNAKEEKTAILYQPRIYRQDLQQDNLKSFEVMAKESDLYICAEKDLSNQAMDALLKCRVQIEEYIQKNPQFKTSLSPLKRDLFAPPIIKEMIYVSRVVGVGPMAGVAGAIASYVGKELLQYSREVIVENGGDIFIKCMEKRKLGICAGKTSLSNKIALEIEGEKTPLGICTSSGKIGHSLSFGAADAVVIISESCALADAAATAVGNIVKTPAEVQKGIDFARNIPRLKGVLIIIADKIAAWGDLKLIKW